LTTLSNILIVLITVLPHELFPSAVITLFQHFVHQKYLFICLHGNRRQSVLNQ